MNGLEWLAQILLTGVFVVDGCIRISSYRRPVKPQLPENGFATIRLAYELELAVAAAEIAGAAALWVPASLWTPEVLPQVAAAGLALLAVAGSIYHVRRREPSAHNLAVFLLAVMVILGRSRW